MKRYAFALILVVSLVSCGSRPEPATDAQGTQREVIQGFQATFYRVNDGKQHWTEIAIAVDGSKTFHMPVFFTSDGQIVRVDENEARRLIDRWVKQRAEDVAAFGSIEPKAGLSGPFLAIDCNNI